MIGIAAITSETKLVNSAGRLSRIGPTLSSPRDKITMNLHHLMSPALTTAMSPDPIANAPIKRSFHCETGFFTSMTSSVIISCLF